VLEKVGMLAHELDCGIQIHTQETQSEVDQSIAEFGQRPLERLNSLGLLGPKTQCVHLAAVNDGDIQLLADTKSHAIHCPRSNMKLASGFCPSQALLDAGINTALGTDSAASNNGLDLFSELNTAALLAKVVSGNAAALPDSAALTMATASGAKALDFENSGTLTTGSAADVIAIDLSQLEQQPVFDPISQLAYTGVASKVSHSWINGRAVMAERQLLTLDEPSILKRATEWRQKIQAKK
jgi:5-methylthioadenosine/S-adenosylhomocysteine deaminase